MTTHLSDDLLRQCLDPRISLQSLLAKHQVTLIDVAKAFASPRGRALMAIARADPRLFLHAPAQTPRPPTPPRSQRSPPPPSQFPRRAASPRQRHRAPPRPAPQAPP